MRLFTAVAAVLAVATVVGLVVLWPGNVETPLAEAFAVDTQRAEVERVEERLCPNFTEQTCQIVTVRVESGPDAGEDARLQLSAGGRFVAVSVCAGAARTFCSPPPATPTATAP